MDSFEMNKIIGALLGVVFVVFSVSIISDALFASPPPAKPGYVIEAAEGDAHGGGAEAEEEPEPIANVLATADASAGENIFRRCQSCHTVEQGGANKVGPNLWNVVMGPVAGQDGFSYSSALQEFSEGGEVVWDYERLSEFLNAPKAYVPGTAMAFAGLKDVQDRADVIMFLREHADEPAPLPEPEPETVEAEPASAEGGEAVDTGGETTGEGEAAEGEASEGQAVEGEEPATPQEASEGAEAPVEEGEATTAGETDADAGAEVEAAPIEPAEGGTASGELSDEEAATEESPLKPGAGSPESEEGEGADGEAAPVVESEESESDTE